MSIIDIILINEENIYKSTMIYTEILNEYELYCPIFTYIVTMGVLKNSGTIRPYLNIKASKIYGGKIYGDCIIIPEEKNTFMIDNILKKLIEYNY
jgi:hypothetical protein